VSGRLSLSREAIIGHRLRVNGLLDRRSRNRDALRAAAPLGLCDSMPRAAVLSLHARVDGITVDVLDEPSLIQTWGPRFSVYVVDERDLAVLTLGRLPRGGKRLERAEQLSDRLVEMFAEHEPMPFADAARLLGRPHNELRHASPTGVVRLAWDGARQPTIWVGARPDVTPDDARRETVRRYLHLMGPATPETFGMWAGVRPPDARATFDELTHQLLVVDTPVGEGWVLADDEASFRTATSDADGIRLLPSGDLYWLLHGPARDLLVASAACRDELWTSRVWPGALLVDGEIIGTWRRAGTNVTVSPWRRLTKSERVAVDDATAGITFVAH